jgi:hypothetical protein
MDQPMTFRYESTDAQTGATTVTIYDAAADTVTVAVGDETPTVRPLTDGERQWLSGLAAVETAATNDTTIRDKVDKALDGLRTIAGSSGNLSAANLSNAVRLLARVQIGLIRLQLSKLDDTSDT